MDFSPSKNVRFAVKPNNCVLGDYPTFGELKTAYGEEFPIVWIMKQLIWLSEYLKLKEPIDANTQLESMAYNVYSRFYYLKVTEFMLFLNNLCNGDYGKVFYDRFSPPTFMEKMREFLTTRDRIIEKAEQERMAREMEESYKNAVPMPEHIRMKIERMTEKYKSK